MPIGIMGSESLSLFGGVSPEVLWFSAHNSFRKKPRTLKCFCRTTFLETTVWVACKVVAPAGFWPRGQNPRRHPRSPQVYMYKDKEYLLKK